MKDYTYDTTRDSTIKTVILTDVVYQSKSNSAYGNQKDGETWKDNLVEGKTTSTGNLSDTSTV